MRFWTTFSRWVGPGGTSLGSDTAPTLPPPTETNLYWDNLMVSHRSLNYRETGPTNRVAVAFQTPAGVTTQIDADLYLYEEQTKSWYRVTHAPVQLEPNAITFFDVVMPLSTAKRLQGDLGDPGGEIQATLVPANPGGLLNGEYKFSMTIDLAVSGSGAGGGTSGNVTIVAPLPLPVIQVSGSTTWFPSTVSALGFSGVLKAVSGRLYQLHGFNGGNRSRYLMLFDSAAVPINGTPSWHCLSVPRGATYSLDWSRPRAFSNGLTWAISTTANTLTIDAAATFWAQGEID